MSGSSEPFAWSEAELDAIVEIMEYTYISDEEMARLSGDDPDEDWASLVLLDALGLAGDADDDPPRWKERIGDHMDQEAIALELEAVKAQDLSHEEALELVAYLTQVARAMAEESVEKERALEKAERRTENLSHAYIRLFRARNEQRRKGGEATRASNKTAAGLTYAEARRALEAAWATGEYPSRNACADSLSARLGVRREWARRCLIGTPDTTSR